MMTPQTTRTLIMITLITSLQCSRFLIRTRDNKTNAKRSFLIRTSDNKTNAKMGHGEGGADYYDSSDYDYYHAANQGLLIFIIT